MISTAKYEKKIEELKTQCQLKTDECHEAWMSLTAANEQLQKVRMELDNKFLQTHYLGKARSNIFVGILCHMEWRKQSLQSGWFLTSKVFYFIQFIFFGSGNHLCVSC